MTDSHSIVNFAPSVPTGCIYARKEPTDGMSGQTTMQAAFQVESIHQPTSLRSVLMASTPRTSFTDMRFKQTL